MATTSTFLAFLGSTLAASAYSTIDVIRADFAFTGENGIDDTGTCERTASDGDGDGHR